MSGMTLLRSSDSPQEDYIMWLIDHWAFVSGLITFVFLAAAAYWKMDKRLSLIEQSITSFKETMPGSMDEKFKNVRDDISRLERKQDKYNTLQERTMRVEIEQHQHDARISALESSIRGK